VPAARQNGFPEAAQAQKTHEWTLRQLQEKKLQAAPEFHYVCLTETFAIPDLAILLNPKHQADTAQCSLDSGRAAMGRFVLARSCFAWL
jgi:hypothetical protein